MDPRIEQIERSQVYGLFDRGVLIYVGATRLPLKKRLYAHRSAVGSDSPIHQYLDKHVEDLREDVEIRELTGYESEQAALDDLKDSTLNVDGPTGPSELRHRWTPEEIDRLEELLEDDHPVSHVADKLGYPYQRVEDAALKLGIEIGIDINWDKWDDKLGEISDQELADKIGCSRTPIKNRRAELGISAYQEIDWSKWDDKLGEISDRELSRKIGCDSTTVKHRREQLDISPFQSYHVATDEEVLQIRVLYEEKSDESYPSLAEKFNLGRTTVGRIVRGDTREHLPMPEDLTEEEKEDLLELSHN